MEFILLMAVIWIAAELYNSHRNEQLPPEERNCPVCGYYCLGKGGVGCINKPEGG